MKKQIDHSITTSFLEKLDNKIVTKGEAFINVSTGFYPVKTVNQQVYAYASPFKQFIYDSSIGGTVNLSGIWSDGVFYSRASGITIDYQNGRVLSKTQLGSNISGTFSLHELNIKYTDKNEDQILMETKYVSEPIQPQQITGIAESVETYPMIYVTYNNGKNMPRAMGGLDSTNGRFTCYAMCNSSWQLDGVLSIMRDMKHTIFALLDSSELPLNVSGDLKNPNYSYNTLVSGKSYPNIVHIEDVNCSKLTVEANQAINPTVRVGIAEFETAMTRNPRL
jgi:hypothetical protein